MDRTGSVTDFSIERILSPQLGRKQLDPGPDGYQRGVPGGFSLDSARSWAPGPVPVVPVPVFCPYAAAFHHHHHAQFCFCAHFGPNPTGGSEHPNLGSGSAPPGSQTNCSVFVFVLSPGGSDATHSGFQQPGEPLQCPQKVRMRTVFTDSQTHQLEALFQLTDYPAVEARAELARNTGLSEETVRVSSASSNQMIHFFRADFLLLVLVLLCPLVVGRSI